MNAERTSYYLHYLFAVSIPDMKTNFPRDAFDKEAIAHKRLQGKYIPNSAVYLGKKAQFTMGKPIGQTRYDFKLDFEKCKQVEYSLTYSDADKKLNGK